jgi:formiminoglutamase
MPNTFISQSQKRSLESLGSLFINGEKPSWIFLKSSTDRGVVRNGGRNGAKYAPQSFLATLKRYSTPQLTEQLYFQEIEVSDERKEIDDFAVAQIEETKKIENSLRKYPLSNIIHLGGGHDHIFPFLCAASSKYKKIIVINVDAHADTRTDAAPNSGTPFRDFSEFYEGEFILFQIGLLPFANSISTLSKLKSGNQDILWRQEATRENFIQLFGKISSLITAETQVVLSIDSDAIAGHELPGVSAVNPHGLSLSDLEFIGELYIKLQKNHPQMIGIYELNPVYDTLASLSMRAMTRFCYQMIFRE